MPEAMIAMRPKRTATQAQRRLHKADPTLAARMVEWETEVGASLDAFAASLEREYELAAATDPAPPIFDEEEKLAYKLGELDLSLDSFLKVADSVRGTRDEACMVLGRVEQDIAQRTLELIRLAPQAALPPPPDSFDGGDDAERFHGLRADGPDMDALIAEAEATPEGADRPGWWPAPAVRVGGWWRRVRGWLRPAAITAAATSLAAITLGGGS